jgi:hypothetical protein
MESTHYIILLCHFFIASFFIPHDTKGQVNITLHGSVKDIRKNFLPYITVGVYKEAVFACGAISDSSGNFSLRLPIGKYQIKISAIGFDDYTIDLEVSKGDSINIILSNRSIRMQEVTLTAERPIIEHKVDRLIFNVENSIFRQGVDAIDLLRQTPRIEITSTEGIKMIGKGGLRVMINGRILNLSEEDLKHKLKSLRSDNISKIEVIATPPSKYSAEGNSGLVNIVLKKNPLLGWQGFVNAAYIQRKYASSSQSGNINYKSKKIEASININNDYSKIENIQKSSFSFANHFFNFNKHILRTENTKTLNTVFKYTATKKSEIGATFDYSIRNGNNEDAESIFYINSTSNLIDSTVNSIPYYKNAPQSMSFSGYYDYYIDSTGKKMSLTYNYSSNIDKSSKDVSSEITERLNKRNRNFIYYGNNKYTVNSFMADFELPWHFAKIETGGSYTYIANKTGLQLYNRISNQLIYDSSISNDFEYSEKNAALYLSGSKDINSKFSVKAGVRYEYSHLNGNSPTLQLSNSTSYGKLFPSIFALYSPDKKNAFSLAYSKRIYRPGFNDLNPFRYYSSVYSYVSGNAYLLPSFTQNIEFSYSHKSNLTFILSYSRLLAGIDYISLFSPDGVARVVPENHFNQNLFLFDVSYTYRPFKWWNSYTDFNIFYTQSKSYRKDLQIPSAEGFGGSITNQNTFTLNRKRTTFWQINYNCFLPTRDGFNHTNFFGYFSTNLRLVALKGNIQVMVSALDLFRQNFTISKRHYFDYSSNILFDARVQNFRISVSYKFGNKKVSKVYRESKNTDKLRAM